MSVILVGSPKGGVGKTTSSIQLATRLAADPANRVWLVDGDRLRHSQKAMTIRSNTGIMPAIHCDHYADGPALRAQVLLRQAEYTHVVIDAGGRDSSALRAALMLCDVMLLPMQPRAFDAWVLDDTLPLLEEARGMRGYFPCLAYLNMADARALSEDNADAVAFIQEFPELEYLPASLVRRRAIDRSSSAGLSVFDWPDVDEKAHFEVKRFVDGVLRALEKAAESSAQQAG